MKGTVIDFIMVLVVVLAFGIMTLIGHTILGEIETKTTEMGVSQIGITQAETAILNLDSIFIFITFGLGIAVIIGGFMVKTHPAFFIVSAVLLLIVVVVSGQIANVWLEFAESESLISSASNFMYMETIFRYLPVIFIVLGFIAAIVIYDRAVRVRRGDVGF